MAKRGEETQRGRKNRPTYPIAIIVCDGKKTEPIYFRQMKMQQRHKPIKIEIVKGAAGQSYDALIKEAERAVNEYVLETDSSKYTVWCVSDVDVDHNTPGSISAKNTQLKKYETDAKRRGFKIVLSNPCFELWYLLHFDYSTGIMQNYNAVLDKLSISAYLPNYKKNSDVYNMLADKQTTATDNAKKLHRYHKSQGKIDFMNVSANPYTNVWKLVEFINN